MFFNLLRKQLIRASGLSPISIWYPWKIKEAFFFFYWSDDFTFYVCWKWSRGKGPLKSLGWKVSKQVCYKEKVPHSFSAKHTHTHTLKCKQQAGGMRAEISQTRTEHMHVCTHPPLQRHIHREITEKIPAAWHHAAVGMIEGKRNADQKRAEKGKRRVGKTEGQIFW